MGRKIAFLDEGWEDYLFWQTHDKKMLKRVNQLLKEMARTPFDGKGKPEPLKGNRAGFWSRRIDDKNRFVYKVTDDMIEVYAARSHYDDE